MFEEPRSTDLPTRIATAVCARTEIMKRVDDADELCELHGVIQEEAAKALIFDKEPFKVGFFESFMHASYIDQMRCHVDEGGRLSHLNGVHLLAGIEALHRLLQEVSSKGLIYWEPQTDRGWIAKMQMIAKIERIIASVPFRKPRISVRAATNAFGRTPNASH